MSDSCRMFTLSIYSFVLLCVLHLITVGKFGTFNWHIQPILNVPFLKTSAESVKKSLHILCGPSHWQPPLLETFIKINVGIKFNNMETISQ